jgi:hypothetical protein
MPGCRHCELQGDNVLEPLAQLSNLRQLVLDLGETINFQLSHLTPLLSSAVQGRQLVILVPWGLSLDAAEQLLTTRAGLEAERGSGNVPVLDFRSLPDVW